jgi:hypothetical protein
MKRKETKRKEKKIKEKKRNRSKADNSQEIKKEQKKKKKSNITSLAGNRSRRPCGEKRYCRPRITFGRTATIAITFCLRR